MLTRNGISYLHGVDMLKRVGPLSYKGWLCLQGMAYYTYMAYVTDMFTRDCMLYLYPVDTLSRVYYACMRSIPLGSD